MSDSQSFCYSVAQLARVWNVSSRYVYELCQRSELGHLRIGALIRIRQTDKEAYEAKQWHAPGSTLPTTSLSNVVPLGMSDGGKMGGGTAFQRGRKSAAKQ